MEPFRAYSDFSSRAFLRSTVRLLLFILAVMPGFSFVGAADAATIQPRQEQQCQGRRDIAFVAHEDDDLLFMNPDIHDTIRNGGCMQVVYLTASERGEGVPYMEQRENGVRAAYALMAGVPNTWRLDPLLVNKVQLARYTLVKNPRVSLVFMRIKDPWLNKGWGDLTPLSRLEIQPDQMAQSLGEYFVTYNRASLVKTLSSLVLQYEPAKVRMLDDSVDTPYNKLCWRCVGHDHPDHIASAKLVRDALAVTAGNYEPVSYVDYPSQERPLTLTLRQSSEKSRVFNLYAQFDYHYCTVPMNCREPLGPAALWVERMYYASRADAPPAALRTDRAGALVFIQAEYSNAVAYWSEVRRKWTVLGGLVSGQVTPFSGAGVIGVFARDGHGQAYVSYDQGRSAAGAAWNPWRRLPVLLTTQPQVVAGDKEIAAVAMGSDGQYRYLTMAMGQAWQISRMPRLDAASQTFDFLQLGRYRLMLAQTLKGEVWMTVNTGGPGWRPWVRADGVDGQGGLTAVMESPDVVQVYYRNRTDGHLQRARGKLRINDKSASLRWVDIHDFGVEFREPPAVLKLRNGQIVVATLSRTGKSILTLVNGEAVRVKGPFASVPVLLDTPDGVKLYARLADANRWLQQYQTLTLKNGDWQDTGVLPQPPLYGGHSFDRTLDIREPALEQMPPDLPRPGARPQ